MHASGDYSITDLTELFSGSGPTVYRTLQRGRSSRTAGHSVGPQPGYLVSGLSFGESYGDSQQTETSTAATAITHRECVAEVPETRRERSWSADTPAGTPGRNATAIGAG